MRRLLGTRSLAFKAISPFQRVSPRSFCSKKSLLLANRDTHVTRRFSSRLPHDAKDIPHEPTIYALSTGTGRAAIAVIRISGSACGAIYKALCPDTKLPKPRYATLRSLHDPENAANSGNLLDSGALVLFFPAPNSVTGEDVLEFHVHGGPAVVKAVLAAIEKRNSRITPVRYAEPGEFTRRAFVNDRLDLPQIEALGDTLSAVTEEQRRLSVQGTVSGLAGRYESWRKSLLSARGELEALIDFSEDQHFDDSPASLAASVAIQVRALASRLAYHSANAVRGELLRNGISICLIGSPNVGKSSLLNQIVGRNAAIVSKEAGTTRDIVEVGLDLGGFFCRLGDTAGLRSAASSRDNVAVLNSIIGEVEQEGIKRAKDKAMESDVVILLLSVEKSIHNQGAQLFLDAEVIETAKQLLKQRKTLVVAVNKMDLYGIDVDAITPHVKSAVASVLPELGQGSHGHSPVDDKIFCISCHHASNMHAAVESCDFTNSHLHVFLAGLIRTFKSITSPLTPTGEVVHPTEWQESLGATERQRVLLDQCIVHLQEFLQQAEAGDGTEIEHPDVEKPQQSNEDSFDIVVAAESLRAAAYCLAKLTGRGDAGDVEEVLGVVFEKFCVGK